MNACKENVILLGAGGHAKVVVATLHEVGYTVTALLDDDLSKIGHSLLCVPVVGKLESLEDYGFCSSIIALGDNQKRQEIALRFDELCDWLTVVHPMAYVHESVKIGVGTVVFARAVLQPDAMIGDHVIINTGATVDHDCRIGNFVHLAPGVHLAGNVSIGNGAFLGSGTVVIPGKTIGEGAVVGAGAVVIDDIPSFAKVAGVPARSIRKGLK